MPLQPYHIIFNDLSELARLISGKTQKEAAGAMGCDASNLRFIELETRKPGGQTLRKIRKFIDGVLEEFQECT